MLETDNTPEKVCPICLVLHRTIFDMHVTIFKARDLSMACERITINSCYIVRVNTKRDWLICGHVTSNKFNISRRATSKKLLPAPTGYVYINKQNGGTTSTSRNYDFPSLCSNKECKKTKNTQQASQATGYAAETV